MIKKADINALAERALQYGNPYIEKATMFMIDRAERYIYADKIMTRAELDNAYLETAKKDIECGYRDRMVGYYDKWYRYSHADEGRAYDLGVRYATEQPKCSGEFHIIEYTN